MKIVVEHNAVKSVFDGMEQALQYASTLTFISERGSKNALQSMKSNKEVVFLCLGSKNWATVKLSKHE